MRVTVSLPLSQRAELMSTLQSNTTAAALNATETTAADGEPAEAQAAAPVGDGSAQNASGRKKASRHKRTQSGEAAAAAIIEEDDVVGDMYTATVLIQPGTFRSLYNFVSQQTGGSGRLDVVAVAAQDAAAAPAATQGTNPNGSGAATEVQNLGKGAQGGALAGGYAAAGGVAGGFTTAVGGSVVRPVAPRAANEPVGEVCLP